MYVKEVGSLNRMSIQSYSLRRIIPSINWHLQLPNIPIYQEGNNISLRKKLDRFFPFRTPKLY